MVSSIAEQWSEKRLKMFFKARAVIERSMIWAMADFTRYKQEFHKEAHNEYDARRCRSLQGLFG